MHQKKTERVDLDPQETSEWLQALDQVVEEAGPDRASFLLERLAQRARNTGVELPIQHNTPYINTIPPEEETPYPGDRALERRIKSLTRWNAMAMVSRQNKFDHGIGGRLCLLSGPRVAGRVCAGVSRRAADAGASGEFSA